MLGVLGVVLGSRHGVPERLSLRGMARRQGTPVFMVVRGRLTGFGGSDLTAALPSSLKEAGYFAVLLGLGY